MNLIIEKRDQVPYFTNMREFLAATGISAADYEMKDFIRLRERVNVHMKGSLRCIAIAATLSVCVGLVVNACTSPELVETFGEKREWSVLQSVEADNRDTSLREPVIRKIFEREVIGVRGSSGENIWIMLKPESPPYYKQMPDGPFDLPAPFVEQLHREHRLSYTVASVLRSHIREK